MLKIGKNELINEDMIESFSIYGNKPSMDLAKDADINGKMRKIRGRYGIKTLIMMNDGYIFLCPFLPDTHMKKLNKDDYMVIDPKRYYIRKSLIREITTKPNTGQHEEILRAKQEMRYVNFAKRQTVKYYIFTVTNRIYGVHSIAEKEELDA